MPFTPDPRPLRFAFLAAVLTGLLFPACPAAADPDALGRADAAVVRATDFLATRQQEDGSWQPDARTPPAITALSLRAMLGSGRFDADSPPITRGFEALLAQQVDDGGIYRDLLANYNTAVAVMALVEARAAAGDDRYTDGIDRGVAYLRRLQWTPETRPDFAGDEPGQIASVSGPDDPFFGGWGYGGRGRGAGRPDLSNAHLTIEALHMAGVGPDDRAMQDAIRFVTRLQNSSETNDRPWAGDDGGFVYGPSADRQGESMAGEFVSPDGQRRLRSYGSMTYAGLKSLLYAGLSRDDERVRAAWDWIGTNWTLDANPGMAAAGEDMADHGLFYYYLVVGRTLGAFGEAEVAGRDWRVDLIDTLARLQRDDGSWAGNPRWREDDPTMATAFAAIALNEARASLASDEAD